MCGCDEEFGDRIMNIGRNHFAVCDEHRYRWFAGSNLFSGWQDETEADWEQNRDELALYSDVPDFMVPEELLGTQGHSN